MTLFAACNAHLCQGDIFFVEVLGAYSGLDLHILRRKDKSPLGGGLADLEYFPFSSFDGSLDACETVRITVDRIRRFIVASQTCDVAGIDHEAARVCTIAKVVSLRDFLADSLPVEYEEDGAKKRAVVTLREIAEKTKDDHKQKILNALDDEFAIARVLREVLPSCRKDAREAVVKAYASRLTEFLNNIVQRKNGHTWYLPQDEKMKLPESFVDFTCLYALPVAEIEKTKVSRIATLASPYKELFSQDLGLRFARVAVEAPPLGPKF